MFFSLLFSLMISLFCPPTPEAEPILVHLNNKTISRAEFEFRLNRDRKQNLKGKELKTYLEGYVLEQIKVSAAEQAGLDTLPAVRNLLANYRKQLVGQYITDGRSDEDKAKELYNIKRQQKGSEEVQIVQIFQPLAQTASSQIIEATKLHFDSIYSALQRDPKLFGEMTRRFSAKKDTTWIAALDCPEIIERHAFSININEFSEPFYSPAGVHIIKVIGKRDIAPYEQILPELIKQVNNNTIGENKNGPTIERLKREMNYTAYNEAISEIRRYGETTKTLFTLEGKAYTGQDFKRFAEVYPMEISAQLEAFVAKSLFDRESQKISSCHPELGLQLKFYRDELLSKEEDKIATTAPDSVALQNFFLKNQSNYRWSIPRFNGALIECIDKKTGKKIRKMLKRQPEEDWAKLIEPFNKTAERIKLTQGIFKVGDNAHVDALAFGGPAIATTQLPYTFILGKKQKSPTDYRDVKDKVRDDYQKYMKQEWIDHLKTTTKVEISEEVLKTVNNH